MISIPFKRSRKPERKRCKTVPLCWLICSSEPAAGGLEKRFSGCPALVRGGCKEKVGSELSLPGWKLWEIQKNGEGRKTIIRRKDIWLWSWPSYPHKGAEDKNPELKQTGPVLCWSQPERKFQTQNFNSNSVYYSSYVCFSVLCLLFNHKMSLLYVLQQSKMLGTSG